MKLSDCTPILRSKNAGPFCLTIDLLYNDAETYKMVKNSKAITPEVVGKLYHTPPEKVSVNCYDFANGIKVTLPRSVGSGCFEDIDVYGAQQHMPLMDLELPDSK